MTWPIGMGQRFKGIYHIYDDEIHVFEPGKGEVASEVQVIKGLESDEARTYLGDQHEELSDEIELVKGASHEFELDEYLAGRLTPVYFGTALRNFGVNQMLDGFVQYAPTPQPREAGDESIEACNEDFTGFVFKIQANMDPKHRDRIAFMRVCSGQYSQGMKMRHVRIGKDVRVSDAVTFLAGERSQAEQAWPGDIIGLHNHGTIQIGDTFTSGADLRFTGIPHFAPELYRRVKTERSAEKQTTQAGPDAIVGRRCNAGVHAVDQQ